MATTSGYQASAQAVADTYGVAILQVREPTGEDLKNRLSQIVVIAEARVPYIGPIGNIEAVEVIADESLEAISASESGQLREGCGSVLCRT